MGIWWSSWVKCVQYLNATHMLDRSYTLAFAKWWMELCTGRGEHRACWWSQLLMLGRLGLGGGALAQGRQKDDFGGIRTHAQKTAALTQRLRPLGHRVACRDAKNKHYKNYYTCIPVYLYTCPSNYLGIEIEKMVTLGLWVALTGYIILYFCHHCCQGNQPFEVNTVPSWVLLYLYHPSKPMLVNQ